MYQPRADRTTRFRMYSCESRLICTGLRYLLARQNLHDAGILKSAHPKILLSEPHFDRGEFATDQVEVFPLFSIKPAQ